eukprot:COSAG01_NODE_46851_length_396_cov_0.764310_1_plen_36_part_01
MREASPRDQPNDMLATRQPYSVQPHSVQMGRNGLQS